MVLVIKSMEVPKNTNVRRKSQKNSVPSIDAENIATDIAWGEFKPNLINVSKAGELQAAATRLMDRAGYR
jgi:hypothetical protein